MAKNPKKFLVGRDARTGAFVPVERARTNPDRYKVERVPKSVGDIPRELKSVIVSPSSKTLRKSSTTILGELRYENKRKKK